jgi:hypothetical protein
MGPGGRILVMITEFDEPFPRSPTSDCNLSRPRASSGKHYYQSINGSVDAPRNIPTKLI